MGTWGAGVFENDAACDFASAVAGGGGVHALNEAIDRMVSSEDNFLEASDAQEGLAAADIIARLRGSPGQQTAYTAAIDAWIKNAGAQVPDELVGKAKSAIARILSEPSELLEAWTESGDFEGWKSAVEALAQRLRQGSDHLQGRTGFFNG